MERSSMKPGQLIGGVELGGIGADVQDSCAVHVQASPHKLQSAAAAAASTVNRTSAATLWLLLVTAALAQCALLASWPYVYTLLLLPLPVLLPIYLALAAEGLLRWLRPPVPPHSVAPSLPSSRATARSLQLGNEPPGPSDTLAGGETSVPSSRATARSLQLGNGATVTTAGGEISASAQATIVRAARSRRSLLLVDVAQLRAALEGTDASDVLAALATTETLHVTLPSDDADFALVSYRQQRSADDDFTLDEHALRSVVREADAAGVRGLWLDAWCYRMPPGGVYDHADFCALLASVAWRARVVLWLPRSRIDASPDGEYQFRLWCTFEACCVAERELPVRIAGAGLTRQQAWLARLGPLLPWVPWLLPRTTDIPLLPLYNSLAILFSSAFPPFLWIWYVVLNTQRGNRTLARILPVLGRQAHLARSGREVLRAMQAGARRAGGSSDLRAREASPSTPRRRRAQSTSLRSSIGRPGSNRIRLFGEAEGGYAAALRRELPWLPAYDRRDVMVVKHVLDVLAYRSPCVAEDNALAFSIWCAALQLPSPGDEPRRGTTLRAWLRASGFELPTTAHASWADGERASQAAPAASSRRSRSGRARAASASARLSGREPRSDERGPDSPRLSARLSNEPGAQTDCAHEAAANEASQSPRALPPEPSPPLPPPSPPPSPPRLEPMLHADADSSAIPLEFLWRLGWTWQRGGSAILANPFGVLIVEAPRGTRWSTLALRAARETPMACAATPTGLWAVGSASAMLCGYVWAVVAVLTRGDAPLLTSLRLPISAMLLTFTALTLALFVPFFAYPQLVAFTRQFGAPPHMPDALGHFDAEGYRAWTLALPLVSIGYVQCVYVPAALVVLSVCGSPARDGFGFRLSGRWTPPDVHPDGALLVSTLVVLWALWILQSSQYAVAQAFHMIARSRQGAGLLAPPGERRHSYLV